MLQKSVLLKRTERTNWSILDKEGYSDLHFDYIFLAEIQRVYLQSRNRMCVQIEQLKVKECKRDITVTGILNYAVEVGQKCHSRNYNKMLGGLDQWAILRMVSRMIFTVCSCSGNNSDTI